MTTILENQASKHDQPHPLSYDIANSIHLLVFALRADEVRVGG